MGSVARDAVVLVEGALRCASVNVSSVVHPNGHLPREILVWAASRVRYGGLFCVGDSFLCCRFMDRNVRGILEKLRLFQVMVLALSPFTTDNLDGPAVATGSGVCVLVSNEFGRSFFSTSSSSLEISTTFLVGFGSAFFRFGM
jgi:hypothetical protein